MNVLLANPAPAASIRREHSLLSSEDHTDSAPTAIPLGNNVSADLTHYVSGNHVNLGISVSVDTRALGRS